MGQVARAEPEAAAWGEVAPAGAGVGGGGRCWAILVAGCKPATSVRGSGCCCCRSNSAAVRRALSCACSHTCRLARFCCSSSSNCCCCCCRRRRRRCRARARASARQRGVATSRLGGGALAATPQGAHAQRRRGSLAGDGGRPAGAGGDGLHRLATHAGHRRGRRHAASVLSRHAKHRGRQSSAHPDPHHPSPPLTPHPSTPSSRAAEARQGGQPGLGRSLRLP